MVFSLYKAAALLFVGSMGVEAASVAARAPPANERVLRAGTRRSALSKRSLRIEPTFELELPYVEEPTRYNGHSIFASQVKVASKKPILSLEDIEHHLEDVQCVNGKISLKFADASSAADAQLACHGPEGGLIVTSHVGCNNAGERAVYTVHGASTVGDGSALELSVADSLFEYAFDSVDVGFGHTEEHHSIREHMDLKIRKRQSAEEEEGDDSEGMVEGAKNATNVLDDVPEDTDPNVHDVKFDLNWEITNKTFRPDQILMGLPVGYSLTNLANLPIELTCKKCMTKGEIVLSQGNIQIDTSALKAIPDKIKAIPGMVASAVPEFINSIPGKMDEAGEKLKDAVAPAASAIEAVPSKVESIADNAIGAVTSVVDAVPSKVESFFNNIPTPNIDLNPFDKKAKRNTKAKRQPIQPMDRKTRMSKRGVDFNLGNVITGGFVELKANNMEAYFEMGAKPKSTGYFTFHVFELPILGFTIPGIGRAGAVFEALLEADYEFEGGFELDYGMNLVVPNDSTMRIDLGNMSKTGVEGFQDSTLTPLPFDFKQKQLDGFVSVAMVPSIPIGFKFLSVLDVGIEAELDLPRLDALISTIDDADTECNDLSYEEEGEFDEETEEETDETAEDEEVADDETTDETTEDEELADDETTDETTEDEELADDETTDDTTEDEELVDDETTDDTTEDEELVDDETTGDEELFDDETADEDLTAEDDEALADDEELIEKKKRSIPKRDVTAIRRASKARRAPASQKAQHRRILKRQSETSVALTNGTNSTQPDKLSLVYIEWNVSMSVILGFNFVLPGMPLALPGIDTSELMPFKPIRKHKTVYSTVKALPTLCLAPKEGYRAATDVYTNPVPVETGAPEAGDDEEFVDDEEVADDEVADDEELTDDSEVADDEELTDDSELADDEELTDDSEVADDEELTDDSEVADDEELTDDSELADDEELTDDSEVADDEELTDDSEVADDEVVDDSEELDDDEVVDDSEDTLEKRQFRKRQYGYGVDIPPNVPATPTPTPTSNIVESTSTPESTPTPPPQITEEVPPPPPASTPSGECGAYGQPACEEPSVPVESIPVESTEVPSSSSEVPPPPETTPVESSSSEVPPPEPTPESSSAPPPPPEESPSTPCTTETPPPAPPASSPCTTSTTITVTLPYNTTSGYQQPPGTASPPVPTKPAEYDGAASTMMPTLSAVVLAFLAMLVL